MQTYLEQFTAMAVAFAPKLALALLTLIVGFWLANKVSSLMGAAMRTRKVDETIIPFLSSIVSVLLKVMVLVSVAGMIGIETTSFAALIAAAGLAIGLALQGSLGHFASGVLLLVFRPYKVGDLVTVAGFTGEVESVQVFNTVLKTLDNKRIIVPNGAITSGPMTNISGQGTIRVDMIFAVDGGQDIDSVRQSVQKAADKSPLILKDPAVDILVNSHEPGTMKFDVRPWCKSEHYWDVYYFMQENVKKQFDADGIRGPKPAMDISLSNQN
ncbi:MAG: mechanosensitive ion channel family protein [Bacteroidetes bacterium]|nr:MAG: mechanosensitive ion channel family protein [Bacteroidota bacterium]